MNEEEITQLEREYANAFDIDYESNKELIKSHILKLIELGFVVKKHLNIVVYQCEHKHSYTMLSPSDRYCNSCHKFLGQ